MEAFADRWILFIGLTLFATAALGVALSVQTMPAPDANEAANTIDAAAGSEAGTHMQYDHSAEEVQVGNQSFALRNDGGTARATVAFGPIIPVTVGDTTYEGLKKVVNGEQWQDVFEDESEFRETARRASADAVGNEEWVEASGTLRVTTEVIDGERTAIVAF